MTQRFAEWIVAFQQAEPADASFIVLFAIAWLVILGYGAVAWWKGFYGRREDPDWIGEQGIRRNR